MNSQICLKLLWDLEMCETFLWRIAQGFSSNWGLMLMAVEQKIRSDMLTSEDSEAQWYISDAALRRKMKNLSLWMNLADGLSELPYYLTFLASVT